MARQVISVLVFGLVACVSAQKGFNPAIILGEPAQEGEIPYQAYLAIFRNGSTQGVACGGSLIRANWILTAGHCTHGYDGAQVSLGSTNINNMPYFDISYNLFTHENYSRATLDNDVALIRLPSNPEGANIATVEMADASTGDLVGATLRASGFGDTADGGPSSNDLLKVDVQGISNQECGQTFNDIRDSNLCTTYLNQMGEGTCEGDSGGPLIWNNAGSELLVGVTSFGALDQCEGNAPNAFARVSFYRDWIEQTIAANP